MICVPYALFRDLVLYYHEIGYDLQLAKDVEKEVDEMCNYATAIENRGIEKGLKALVRSLKKYLLPMHIKYNP